MIDKIEEIERFFTKRLEGLANEPYNITVAIADVNFLNDGTVSSPD
jgi:hypothetical protein